MNKLEALEATIAERGGEDALWDRLASTEDIVDLAREYGTTLRTLNAWKNKSDDRRTSWDEALQISAHAFAAEGKAILDELHTKANKKYADRLESAHVALATARANQRLKLAAARNPAAYGERPQVQVNASFNIQQLHLEALKAKGSMAALPKPEIPTLEARVIEE